MWNSNGILTHMVQGEDPSMLISTWSLAKSPLPKLGHICQGLDPAPCTPPSLPRWSPCSLPTPPGSSIYLTNHVADKCQGYIPRNYKFYWSQVWDPLRLGKEANFTWSIWHKVVAVNEWRAQIASISIYEQCIFCLPNTSEAVKHKLWDYIQARRAWRWATFIMHELCSVRSGDYDGFHWK